MSRYWISTYKFFRSFVVHHLPLHLPPRLPLYLGIFGLYLQLVRKDLQVVPAILEAESPFEGGVPMVLDRVVGSSFQQPRDERPTVTELFVGLDDGLILFFGPTFLVDLGIKVVVESTLNLKAYLSRHCFPMRPGRCFAIWLQFFGP